MPSQWPYTLLVATLVVAMAAQTTGQAPYQISVISGANQSVDPVTSFAPIFVPVTDAVGNGVSGATVEFSSPNFGSSGLIFFTNPTAVITDGSGLASIQLTAGGVTGNFNIDANVTDLPGAPTTSISFTVLPWAVVTILSGGGQAGDFGDDLPDPVVFEARTFSGAPIVGASISFVITDGQANLVNLGQQTDAAGQGAFLVNSIATGLLTNTLRIIVMVRPLSMNLFPFEPAPVAEALFFVRELRVDDSGLPASLTITYDHEDGPQGLIMAVDVPQPGPVSTPYGNVRTSILNALPTALVFDPAGLFGAADPTLLANPSLSRTYSVPPSLAGFQGVVQIYGVDADYLPELNRAVFISNPAYFTL